MSDQYQLDEIDNKQGSQQQQVEEKDKKQPIKDADIEEENIDILDKKISPKDSPPNSIGNLSKKASSNDFQMKVSEVQELMAPSHHVSSAKRSTLLISVDDSIKFPSVFLEHSPKGHRSLNVKIPMYKTTTFMKIQTQLYVLEISDPNHPNKQFQVERRYSQFICLYESLFYNQPGFILCPFPDKNFSSFFKIKLGINTNQSSQKVQLIQKRMAQLERFVNYVTHHPQLRNSEQINIFLYEDRHKFEEEMQRVQRYAEENRNIEQPSQVKNWMDKGKNLWSTYIKKQPQLQKSEHMRIGLNDIQFTEIHQNLISLKKQLMEKIRSVNSLFCAEKQFSQFTDFKTQNDVILKLCAKQSSTRQFCKKFTNLIQIKILDQLNFNLRSLSEAEKVIQYRNKISVAYSEINKQTDAERKLKIGRRIQVFDTNFLGEWETFSDGIQNSMKLTLEKLQQYWNEHKKQMRKVWKKKI